MSLSVNDNDGIGPQRPLPVPDAHGQAALLLAESMLHTLIEASALTRPQAIETVQTAIEVKIEVAEVLHEPKQTMRASLALLTTIRQSLEHDLP